jgi:hypothetical protein
MRYAEQNAGDLRLKNHPSAQSIPSNKGKERVQLIIRKRREGFSSSEAEGPILALKGNFTLIDTEFEVLLH